MSDSQDFDYTIHCERAAVAEHLETLARFFRDGQIKLTSGGDSIDLQPAERVKLELKAKTKPEKSKGELEVTISWKEKDSLKPIEINAAE